MFINRISNKLINLSRSQKRIIMFVADAIIIVLSLWGAYALRLSEFYPAPVLKVGAPLFFTVPVLGLMVFATLGIHNALTRYLTSKAVKVLIFGVALISCSIYPLATFFNVVPFPRSVPIIFGLLAVLGLGGTRMLVRGYFNWARDSLREKDAVAIYGAGASGAQLARWLVTDHQYAPLVMIDDDESLLGSDISGLRVKSFSQLPELIKKFHLKAVIIAIPSLSADRQAEILSSISAHGLVSKFLYPFDPLVNSDAKNIIKDAELELLLGRAPVPPREELLKCGTESKRVMVTGAGGSIGSEICRQVIKMRPNTLVLLDQDEFSLYKITNEMLNLLGEAKSSTKLVSVLGSVNDSQLLKSVITGNKTNTVYHSAAYKHVPLLEENILQAVNNNVLGTKKIGQVAMESGVECFVLVSTDKAVRPTSIMGATKRFAELIIQDLSLQGSSTRFSMVRFGNVLGSSGSVVPLFREQLKVGGPITVTHPEITRYFMMISEAASLVIQAGAMAKGGDLFVLDMGKPIKIVDLANTLISLSGKRPYTFGNAPLGDVAIKFTGLRPGEKLYEELLISGDVESTMHPRIMKAREQRLQPKKLAKLLTRVERAVKFGDNQAAFNLLCEAVEEYVPDSVQRVRFTPES